MINPFSYIYIYTYKYIDIDIQKDIHTIHYGSFDLVPRLEGLHNFQMPLHDGVGVMTCSIHYMPATEAPNAKQANQSSRFSMQTESTQLQRPWPSPALAFTGISSRATQG